MRNGNNYSASEVIKAIKGSGGIVSTIAQKLGCEWHTAKKYIAKFPTAAEAFNDECQKPLDMAESVVYKNIEISYTQAVKQGIAADSSDAKWLLSKKGKSRGYADTHKIEIEMAKEVEKFMADLEAKLDPELFEQVLSAYAE